MLFIFDGWRKSLKDLLYIIQNGKFVQLLSYKVANQSLKLLL